MTILDDMHAEMLREPENFILLPYDELDRVLQQLESGELEVSVYTDPLLQVPELRETFLRQLFNCGLIVFRRGRRATIGCFFVGKKGD